MYFDQGFGSVFNHSLEGLGSNGSDVAVFNLEDPWNSRFSGESALARCSIISGTLLRSPGFVVKWFAFICLMEPGCVFRGTITRERHD